MPVTAMSLRMAIVMLVIMLIMRMTSVGMSVGVGAGSVVMRVMTMHDVMLATLVHRRPKKPPYATGWRVQRRCVNAEPAARSLLSRRRSTP